MSVVNLSDAELIEELIASATNDGRDSVAFKMAKREAVYRMRVNEDKTSAESSDEGERLSPTLEYVLKDRKVDNRDSASMMFDGTPEEYVLNYKLIKFALAVMIGYRSTKRKRMRDLFFTVQNELQPYAINVLRDYTDALGMSEQKDYDA